MPDLVVENLRARLGRVEILRNVSLEAWRSELVAVMGPNGAGKTTFLRVLARIVRKSGGRVELLGKDIYEYSRREYAKLVAYSSLERTPGFRMRVREVLETSLYPLALPRNEVLKRIEWVAKVLDIEHLLDRDLATLSSGEFQRVSLATCIARKPTLLLLDEPVAHLDPKHQLEVLHLVRDLSKELKIVTLMVLHDPKQALDFCDRAMLLRNGATIAHGEVSKVLTEELLSKTFDVKVRIVEVPNLGRLIHVSI